MCLPFLFFFKTYSYLFFSSLSDTVAVTNPLHAGRQKRHKQTCVYFCTASVPAWCRYKLASMQLVMVYPESHLKDFGLESVYKVLVDDLLRLEQEGVLLSDGTRQKVGVAAWISDNLEAHLIGKLTFTNSN